MNVRFLAPARRELMREAAWYDDRSPGLGDRMLEAAGAAIRMIREFPDAQPPDDGPYRRCLLDVFPFALIYRLDEDQETSVIIAFAHLSRKPKYWRRREKLGR
jgi:toxin ParE1/3/4